MKVTVTGAAGFVGSRLADALLRPDSPLPVTELVLVDTILPAQRTDSRVRLLALDLRAPTAANQLITADCDVFFHLAAIVSGQSEADFDLGLAVNFDATRALLEAARRNAPSLRFVFASTSGVFGGELPDVINDRTATMPQTSYGTAKAMCELLINDYSRRKFLDGRFVRLPTVSIRAGTANAAMTSYASGILREPLNGKEAVCPVRRDQKIWITSPAIVVRNIIHAATISADVLGDWRGINLPGFAVSVDEQLRALKEVAGEKAVALVRFERDERICHMVESLPIKFDNSRALSLGFVVDTNFADVLKAYIRNELNKSN
ncbi:D-erythronate dehydrogenase-like [Galleria mellonella]|uniref:D-erythronate dehydrogenase-like n=1 Tax=Galleria mellonella TaxID=7137 RepID=A0A6J1WM97_GALME|nr:D-erythronate dehydrogenase-like [Galleria mellonella]